MKRIFKWLIGAVIVIAVLLGIKRWHDKKIWNDRSSILVFKGRILDQNGQPVPGGQVTAAYPYSRGGKKGLRTEYDFAYTDDAGYFTFNSTPRRHHFAEVFVNSGFDDDGNFYRGEQQEHITFSYEPGSGWQHGLTTVYDQGKGWIDSKPTVESIVTLRAGRSEGVQRLVYGSHITLAGDQTYGQGCFNASEGKFYPDNNSICDLRFSLVPCPGDKGTVTEVTAPDGGVIWYHPNFMSRLAAPPGDYPKSIQIIYGKCNAGYLPAVKRQINERSPQLFFYSRKRQVYGYVELHVATPEERKLPNNSGWLGMTVYLNPRGNKTLAHGDLTGSDVLNSLQFPVEIPYRDYGTLDYSKIEVGEDKEIGEVFVRGLPGAAPMSKYMLIKNFSQDKAEDGHSINDKVNLDGSFEFRLKADLRGRIYLYATFEADAKTGEGPDGQIIALTKLVKLTEEAKKNHGLPSP